MRLKRRRATGFYGISSRIRPDFRDNFFRCNISRKSKTHCSWTYQALCDVVFHGRSRFTQEKLQEGKKSNQGLESSLSHGVALGQIQLEFTRKLLACEVLTLGLSGEMRGSIWRY
ncbi:hypothetical protein MA16_Dca003979 [Dendrobium catenatum]|uniref:Uncharacterized protein n=1 Tax=Dendrobium catenatum TaxID=906689 RepID=A0A2I0X227_9ASPA|nr:hypothetical protein MA16_Dca003979 [Dendrobium catenatum]